MANFLDQLGKKLTDAGQETAGKAKAAAEVGKWSYKISTVEKHRSALFQELGKWYYQEHKNEEDLPEIMVWLKNAEEEIHLYQEQIQRVKQVELCPKCGAEMSSRMDFCGSCGTALVHPVIPEREIIACPHCHTLATPEDHFCQACGTQLKELDPPPVQ